MSISNLCSFLSCLSCSIKIMLITNNAGSKKLSLIYVVHQYQLLDNRNHNISFAHQHL